MKRRKSAKRQCSKKSRTHKRISRRTAAKRSKAKAGRSSAKKRSAKPKGTKKRAAAKAKSRKMKKSRPKSPGKVRRRKPSPKARAAKKRAPAKKVKKKPLKVRAKKVPKRAKPVKVVAKPKRAKPRPALSREERKKKRAKDLAKLIAMQKKKKQTAPPVRKPKVVVAQKTGHESQAARKMEVKTPGLQRMSHIRKRELENLRSELLAERERLIRELKALDEITHTNGESGGNHQIPGYSIHLAEYATDNQTIETALDLRRIQQERLTQVEEALQRVERGDYGICESCGKAININRLLAKPFARFCVPCRRAYEAQRS